MSRWGRGRGRVAGLITRRSGVARGRARALPDRLACTSACRTPGTRRSRSWRWSIRCALRLMPCGGGGWLGGGGQTRTRRQRMTWVLVAFIGLVGGVVSGLFGVGGAIVIVPALVLLVRLPTHTASGTSLAALLLPVGLLGAMEYYRRGQVNVPYAIVLAAGLFVWAFIGGDLAGEMSDVALKRAFGGVLLLVAGKLLVG